MKTSIKNVYCKSKEDTFSKNNKSYKSSYKKEIMEVGKILKLTKLGFLNDTQGDRNHHGGVDKAVCVYSEKYYTFFKKKYDLDFPICAFGENFTILDLDDSEICLGDRFSFGEAIFEVSQPRQPCFKISSMLGVKNLTALVTKEHKTGFYFRVIKEAHVKAGENLVLISREYPKFTIEYINKCSFNTKENQENIKEILTCSALAKAYRASLERRYVNGEKGLQNFQRDDYV